MPGKSSAKGRDRGTIVIRKEEIIEGGHHGGAWKVAYADFVTAMMAFFLLMWLLNATTEAQRKGIADYFTPNNVLSRGSSGSGLPFGGQTPFSSGNMVSDRGAQAVMQGKAQADPNADDPNATEAPGPVARGQGAPAGQHGQLGDPRPPDQALAARNDPNADSPDSLARDHGPQAPAGGTAPVAAPAVGQTLGRAAQLANAGPGVKDPSGPAAAALDRAALAAQQAAQQTASFEHAAAQIRAAIAADPRLAALATQISIDQTPEGLRIQMLDAARHSMFATGSAELNDYARLVLEKIAPVLNKLQGDISVVGHTDAAPYRGSSKTNWDLSTERALATRRMLAAGGVDPHRFRTVSGVADRDPLLPADPLAAANRRIAITVLRAPPAPAPAAPTPAPATPAR